MDSAELAKPMRCVSEWYANDADLTTSSQMHDDLAIFVFLPNLAQNLI